MFLENNSIKLSENERENIISIGEKHYQIDFLKKKDKYVQGGNGIIFKITDEQENQEYVIKFLKFPEQARETDWKIKKRLKRFEREIEALYIAKTNELSNIVQIEFSGTHNIDGLDFHYYVMQKCDCTLDQYLLKNELDISQKTLLCQKILAGIKGLNYYKIYHRDIKHNNVYFIGNEPYIGDLGLADYRNSDIWINERGELIGPSGWFSPEAINKYLIEKTPNIYGHDCTIDDKSEVFQLGKLFWYIYQGNVPIGQIIYDDFYLQDKKIFDIIFRMLRYSKSERIDSDNVASKIHSYLSRN